MSICNKIIIVLKKICYTLIIGVFLVEVGYVVYQLNFTDEAMREKVSEIYSDIWRQTGQSQDMVPLQIIESPTINAYYDGTKIVIYTGLIDSTNSWDEVALVLGHEVAHANLYHLKLLESASLFGMSDAEISILEANADKMGALYMMKAGYDVCKGREMFVSWKARKGDYLGGDHPNYAYRYDELNIGCSKYF